LFLLAGHPFARGGFFSGKRGKWKMQVLLTLFVSLVYYAEITVRWFVVREKYCWIAADSADNSKRTGRLFYNGF
jgi:hypothetical protein